MSAAADPLASDVAWAPEELGEALQALAEAAGLRHAAARLGGPSPTRPPNAWIEAAARRIGLEAEPVATPCTELATLLRRGAPALVALPPRGAAAPPTSTGGFGEADDPRGARYLALVSATRRHVLVVGPDRATRRLPLEVVRQRLAERNEASGRREVERLASGLGLNDRQSRRAVEALLRRRLADVDVGGIWLVRDPAGGFEGAGRRLVELVGSHVAELACMLAAWTLLGWMTATGRFDSGWMTAWGLLIALCVPFRWLTQTIVGRWLLEFGAAARRRLLTGALGLDPDRVRADGTGGLMGRVLEVESLEQLALGGGITGALAALEILLAAGILGWFAGQPGLVAWLAVTVAAASGLGWLAFRRRVAWTDERLALTNDLVERMIGHRTTLAQESAGAALAAADRGGQRYVEVARHTDDASRRLETWTPALWMLGALAWLGPPFLYGTAPPAVLALALAGVLLARQGLTGWAEGLERLAGAADAWCRLRPLLSGGGFDEPCGDPDFAAEAGDERRREPGGERETSAPRSVVLEGRELSFRHAGREDLVLREVDVTLRRGERVLLEGPSGGGKSTLAAILSGARSPRSGVLALGGLDRPTLGAAWRRRVVLAPQFHDNHVLTGTLLFNALLGRDWPPTPEDVRDAERVLRALDLGPLLERMPAGLLQMVGETGWQLSHGERSRLFLARALLQGAEVVLLDESFAALDPETLSKVLPRTLDLAPTLVVVAHP